MPCRLRAWLRRKLGHTDKTRRGVVQETASSDGRAESEQSPDPVPSSTTETPKDVPPSYQSLHPQNPSPGDPATPRNRTPRTGVEDLSLLRARQHSFSRWPGRPPPCSRVLSPPQHESTPFDVAYAAADTARRGVGLAFLEREHSMVAARTAHAIAVAVSTSRSYGAFIAAITAAESVALILAESIRYDTMRPVHRERLRNACVTAADVAIAAETGTAALGSWPSLMYGSQPSEPSPRPAVTSKPSPHTPPTR